MSPLESVEPHVTLNIPLSHVTPILIYFSSSVPVVDPSSPSSSSIPLECTEAEVTSVSFNLPIWACKTLEFAGSEVGNLSNPHRNRSNFALMTKVLAIDDPTSYAQGKPQWEQALTTMYESLMKNKTWSLVTLTLGKNLVGCKWVYKTKFTAEGRIEKYKSRLVAKGFNQLEAIDYNETFAPVAKMNTIRTILSIASSYK